MNKYMPTAKMLFTRSKQSQYLQIEDNDGKPLTERHLMLKCWMEDCINTYNSELHLRQQEEHGNGEAGAQILRERENGRACPGDEKVTGRCGHSA